MSRNYFKLYGNVKVKVKILLKKNNNMTGPALVGSRAFFCKDTIIIKMRCLPGRKTDPWNRIESPKQRHTC